MDQLLNYLNYMKDLDIDGLYLSESPFFRPGKGNIQKHSVQKNLTGNSDLSAARSSQAGTSSPSGQPAAVKESSIAFNAKEIMELSALGDLSNRQETQRKAAAIEEASPKETLQALYAAFHRCTSCALHSGRTNFVFGEGPESADLMFIGEGPGYDEDRTGRPFVGKAGQLLDRIISAMGFKRSDVFIANIVKCRPPDNRDPSQEEMQTCGPILEKQVRTIQPRMIVCLGRMPVTYFMGKPTSIIRQRGQIFDWNGVPVMPTFHPAYILRNPASKRQVWDDMQAVMKFLQKSK